MVKFLRKLSLTFRLTVIGIIPVIFLSYFSYLIFNEKNQKIALINENIRRVQEAQASQELLTSLSFERRYSFNYLQEKSENAHSRLEFETVKKQRKVTDENIQRLETLQHHFGKGFGKYPFLEELDEFRNSIDTSKDLEPKEILQFYTDIVYRINSMNTPSPPTGLFSFEVYQNFISQKILNDLITYLGMIRTQIYSYFLSGDKDENILQESTSVYNTYKSFEREFLIKSTPEEREKYKQLQADSVFISTIYKFGNIFNTGRLSYSGSLKEWYGSSGHALLLLRNLQREIWNKVNASMNDTKNKELQKRNYLLFFLIASVSIIVGILISFGISLINLLNNIASAAKKIAKGDTNVSLKNFPKGSLGALGNSILDIRDNNIVLAEAANEIGKGNFGVTISPRSDVDLLSQSIKKMKQDLREHERQKDRIQNETLKLLHQKDDFFNITSHELKTPITSIKAYSQLLLMENAANTTTPQHEMLIKMDQQINKLISLINNLLDTSKLQSGKILFEKAEVKLNVLVAELIKKMHATHPDFKIVFQKNMNGSILADKARIAQVIENLMENAIKYSPHKKEAVVRLEKTEKSMIFSIKDFGLGIKPGEESRIFERFYRITDSYMHTYPGVGLGLFIAAEIIKNHNGTIGVKSEYGQGSIFYFELPLMES